MARSKSKVAVVYSSGASLQLGEIYRYNADKRSEREADRYEGFLLRGIGRLATEHDRGKPVEDYPGLQYVTLKTRTGGDGHIVVYEFDSAAKRVAILHVFHTKQDWRKKL